MNDNFVISPLAQIDLNWGGAGYATYAGKCHDDGGQDQGAGNAGAQGSAEPELSTAEKAWEFWDKGESGDHADRQQVNQDESSRAGDQGKNEAGSQGQADDKGEKEGTDGKSAELTDEQLQANPKYQELETFRNEVQLLMEQHQIPDQKELGLQLQDATILYNIAAGRATPSQLLDLMANNAGWGKDQLGAVAGNLIEWLTSKGFLKDGGAADGQARGKDGKFVDPVESRVEKLERERAEEKTRGEEQKQDGERKAYQEKIFKSFTEKVGELMKAKGLVDDKGNLDQAQVNFYWREVRALMPQTVFDAICKRIEKGNFVDVERHFATVYNAEVGRLQKYNKVLTINHERKEKTTPRVYAGGGTPAPAGQQKRNLRNYDERIAAANAEWDK